MNAGTNITSFDTILSTPTPAGHICAQSVFNYRTDNTSGSLEVYRQIYLLCSNGDVQLQEWLVGDHPKITDVVFQSGLTWYIHYIDTIPLISVQDTGMIGANGNQTALAESIRHGADVYITYASQHRLLSSVQFEEYVTGVYGQVSWEYALDVDSKLHSDPHTYLTMYSSMSVKRQIIRRYMYDSGSLTPLSGVQTGGMEWKVSDDWSLALEVNQNGEVVQGSVDCLIDLIRQGHRIKVGTDGIYEEATMVWVHENKVWAQTIDSLSRQGSQFYTSDPVYRSLHVISSSGLVQVYHISFYTGQDSPVESKTASQKWFADKSNWKTVGMLDPIISRRRVRFSFTQGSNEMYFHADAIFRHSSLSTISSYKHLDVEESMPGYFQLKMPPVWSFYYVNSNMVVETIKWVHDQAKLESFEQFAVSCTVYTIQWSLW